MSHKLHPAFSTNTLSPLIDPVDESQNVVVIRSVVMHVQIRTFDGGGREIFGESFPPIQTAGNRL